VDAVRVGGLGRNAQVYVVQPKRDAACRFCFLPCLPAVGGGDAAAAPRGRWHAPAAPAGARGLGRSDRRRDPV